jgi:hypothetical protein
VLDARRGRECFADLEQDDAGAVTHDVVQNAVRILPKMTIGKNVDFALIHRNSKNSG